MISPQVCVCVNSTVSGRVCQFWSSTSPHAHTYTHLGGNYCRNPDGFKQPWCYTTDPGKRWELCPDLTCGKGTPSAVSPVDFTTLETPSSSASDSSKPNRTSSPSSSRTPRSSTTSSTTSPRTGPSSTTTSRATSGSTSNYFPSNLDGSLSGWNFFVVGILLFLLL